jgi:hypothetical protein
MALGAGLTGTVGITLEEGWIFEFSGYGSRPAPSLRNGINGFRPGTAASVFFKTK